MSRDKEKKIFEEIASLIKIHDRFLLNAHIDPDGDCIGSMLSIAALLETMGKSVGCYIPGTVSEKYKKLSHMKLLLSEEEIKEFEYEVLFVLDTPTNERGGNIIPSDKEPVIVNIDHHPTNERFGSVNFVKDNAAATAVLVYYFLSYLGEEFITPEIADYLYLGIVMDTGCFKFQNTNAESLFVASKLVEFGARPSEITREFFYMKKFRAVQLLSHVLSNMQLYDNGRIAVIELTNSMLEKYQSKVEDTEGFIDYATAIEGVELAVFLREVVPGQVRASLRSLNNMDVASLAEQYGGGGHKKAAGLTFNNNLEESRNIVISGFREMLHDK